MFVYSVLVTIKKEIENEWREFMLNKHLRDVLNTRCFTSYKMLRELSETENDEYVNYRIDYNLVSKDKMDNYISDYSKELRDDVVKIFDGKFTATRTFSEVIKSFN
jgi:hypothetical protein